MVEILGNPLSDEEKEWRRRTDPLYARPKALPTLKISEELQTPDRGLHPTEDVPRIHQARGPTLDAKQATTVAHSAFEVKRATFDEELQAGC
jgi:hypothetical protein